MKRRELREHIFQLLFRVEFNGQEDMQEQVDLFVDDMKENGEVRPEDEAYISGKYQKIMEKLPEIDAVLEGASKGWKIGRMNKVDLTILRLAVYEMKYDEDVPVKVAINEAVEISKTFGGEDSASFINGILGKVAREAL